MALLALVRGQHPDGSRRRPRRLLPRTPPAARAAARAAGLPHPELVPELHLRAARWFARHGMALQAVSHYGSAGCWQEAAEMVVDDGLIADALRPSSPPLVQRLAEMPEDTPGAAGRSRPGRGRVRPGRRAGVRRGPGPRRAGSWRGPRAAPGRGPRCHPAGVRCDPRRSGGDARVRDAGRGRPSAPLPQGRRRPAVERQPTPMVRSTPTCSRCCSPPRGSPSSPPATCPALRSR